MFIYCLNTNNNNYINIQRYKEINRSFAKIT